MSSSEHTATSQNEQRFMSALRSLRRGGDGGVVDLCHLRIDDDRATQVAQALGRGSGLAPALTSLFLCVNSIGPAGARAIADAAASLARLAELSLDRNDLGTDGAAALAAALAADGAAPALRGLSLQANRIGPALPEPFLRLTRLRRLGLGGNALEAVPPALLRAVPRVDLEGNPPALAEFLRGLVAGREVGDRPGRASPLTPRNTPPGPCLRPLQPVKAPASPLRWRRGSRQPSTLRLRLLAPSGRASDARNRARCRRAAACPRPPPLSLSLSLPADARARAHRRARPRAHTRGVLHSGFGWRPW